MTEARRMQLHLGKCIEDLDKMYNMPDLKHKKAKLLCNTAQKLFEKAEKSREKGDEETSYVCYMKYLRVVAYLSKDPEYIRDKKFFNDLLGVKNPNKAISMAEVLKSSLISRYDTQQKAKRLADIKENEYVKQKIDEERSRIIVETSATHKDVAEVPTGLPSADDVTIKCMQLFPLLKDSRYKVMILDTRSNKDFQESHICHPLCISVPEQIIAPGQSANVLENNLPMKSKLVWVDRGSMDLIVLLDWSSRAVIPGKPLHLLKTILLKWDVKTHYRRGPVALEGGYEDWLLCYPSLTTNPAVTYHTPVDNMEDVLGDIDYPSWADISPVQTRPPVSITSTADATMTRAQVGGAGGVNPFVDRSSKAAAIQTYEDRARNLQLLLEKQEKIADTSLSLEMQRIEAEQDWEKVRVQHDAEAKEDLRASYQLREQEIISQLMQLENKQFDMEQENQNLREQLEEYQRREREEAARLAESIVRTQEQGATGPADLTLSNEGAEGGDAERALVEQLNETAARELAAKQARIRAVEEQRAALDRTREMLEMERKRKLAEAREKKKPHLSKDGESGVYSVPLNDGTSSTAGLNRSQSSPNIAKTSSEEESTTPQFDRSVKPRMIPAVELASHHRDFQPVWGEVDRGLTGLKNLGNTCYMNSVIQCLNNTSILSTYFCNEQYREHVNRGGAGTRGAIAEELAAVVRALWSGHYRFIAAKDLRNVVGKHQRTFSGCEQQDSHEFLTILMDWLHDDLQFPISQHHKDSLPASEKAWQEYTKSRESLILRLFYGQIKSTVRCTVCDKESVTYESFSNLSLELPANANRCTLSDCLRLYLNGETIPGWNCPLCKEKRNAVKKLDISRLPPVLVIHFKRFYADPKDYNYNSYRKKQTYIDFPLEDLDMGQFALRSTNNQIYSLYGVSNHYGSMEGGHYTAYCKSSLYGKWYKFDDHVVSEISPSDVKSSAAYILFYTSYNQSPL